MIDPDKLRILVVLSHLKIDDLLATVDMHNVAKWHTPQARAIADLMVVHVEASLARYLKYAERSPTAARDTTVASLRESLEEWRALLTPTEDAARAKVLTDAIEGA